MGSGRRRSGLGPLWGGLLGLLPHLWVHLGFKLSLGLAPISLRRLELLLLRLGLGSGWWLRPYMVSGGGGAKSSSGVDHAGAAAPSAWRYLPTAGSAAGGRRSRAGCEGPMGLRARVCSQARSSASDELQWTHGCAGRPSRRSPAGIYRSKRHRARIARVFGWHLTRGRTAGEYQRHVYVGRQSAARGRDSESQTASSHQPTAERWISRAVL
jgi:hypothetical protein